MAPRRMNQHLEVLIYRRGDREARVERQGTGDWWVWLRDDSGRPGLVEWRVIVEASPNAPLAAKKLAREWVEARRQAPPGHRAKTRSAS